MDMGPAHASALGGEGESENRGEETRPTRAATAAARIKKNNTNGYNYGRFIQLIEKKEYAAAWQLATEVSHKRIQQIVEQTTKEVIKTTAAAAAITATKANEPRGGISIPSKYAKELIVQPPEIDSREPPEIVQAVAATVGPGIVAATKRKNDIVLRCKTKEDRDRLMEDNQWAQQTFGETTKIRKRKLQLFLRVPLSDALTDPPTNWLRINEMTWITAKPYYRRGEYKGYILAVETVEEANRYCENGFVVNGKVHKMEPFCGEGRPVFCFRCGQYGHKAMFCSVERQRCLRCGTSGHEEKDCIHEEKDTFCVACKGTGHSVYQMKDCPIGRKQWKIAKTLWRDRPRYFCQNTPTPPPPAPAPAERQPTPAPAPLGGPPPTHQQVLPPSWQVVRRRRGRR